MKRALYALTAILPTLARVAPLIGVILSTLWLLTPQAAAGTPVTRETSIQPLPLPVIVEVKQIASQRVVAQFALSEAQEEIKTLVATAFPDVPQMLDVIHCESRYRQFDGSGDPLLSPTDDVGVMQINQTHWKEARALGLDIFNSIDDNIKMGRIVYDKQGIRAWTCAGSIRSTGRQ